MNIAYKPGGWKGLNERVGKEEDGFSRIKGF